MPFVPEEFYQASVAVDHPIALEPEGGGSVDSMKWGTLGWGVRVRNARDCRCFLAFPSALSRSLLWQYWSYPFAPPVDNWKWLEPQRLTHACDRWNKNKTDPLQLAYFNGDGFETWWVGSLSSSSLV